MSEQVTAEQVMAFLQNPENLAKVGLKYAPKQRVNISANQDGTAKNLLFSDGSMSGGLGRNENGQIYYMASVRGYGRFKSQPIPASKISFKDGKLHIEIDYATKSDVESNLIKAWLDKKAKPTLAPAKRRDQTTETEQTTETQVEQTVQTAPTPTQTSVPSGKVTLASLTDEQKKVMQKALSVGLYSNIQQALDNFDDWKNTKLEQLG